MPNDQHTQHYGPDVLNRLTEEQPDWCLRWADAQREIERLRAIESAAALARTEMSTRAAKLEAAIAENLKMRVALERIAKGDIRQQEMYAVARAALNGEGAPRG